MAYRYSLYGLIPKEREVNEVMSLEEQNVGDTGDRLIYTTDDPVEAREIYAAGGFMRDGKWHVVTRAVDNFKGTASQHPIPRKTDYDQS